jgi:hypothetical protein
MLLVRYIALFLACFGAFLSASGQISPPGLDDTKAVVWAAVGFTQQWNSKWQTSFYTGGSRESNANNYSLLVRQAIAVIDVNQLYRFNEHWSLAGCLSYRKQDFYEEGKILRDEIRYYARLYYRHKIKRLLLTYSFRPEYRTYYYLGDESTSELRLRLKAQAAVPLNQSGSNQFVAGNEFLWTNFVYQEDRLTTYFRHTFKKPSLIVDAGVMYQVVKDEGLITHLAFDFIFIDPFGKRTSKK